MYLATLVQFSFALPDVKGDTESFEVVPYASENFFIGIVDENLGNIVKAQLYIFFPFFPDQLFSNFNDVISHIAVFWEGIIFAEEVLIPCKHREAEKLYLSSRIVDIVFSFNIVSRCMEKIRQGMACRGTPSVSKMERPGWISADKLNLDFTAFAYVVS